MFRERLAAPPVHLVAPKLKNPFQKVLAAAARLERVNEPVGRRVRPGDPLLVFRGRGEPLQRLVRVPKQLKRLLKRADRMERAAQSARPAQSERRAQAKRWVRLWPADARLRRVEGGPNRRACPLGRAKPVAPL